MTESPATPVTIDSAEAALDAGLAAAFSPFDTGDYHSRAAGFMPAEVAGNVIAGKYKLLERIGEGGMGSVWMAQQTEPVKRHVAVKLIKTGVDSKQVLARFEAERQALAVMDHPNIAKILDGGVAGNGAPYFVMELVKGVPITKYCDEHKLTPRQRLELFVPVCQAIQHAHQKGIIHRDIKPSNVMVALYDDRPIPKVIDFGVAKATGHSLTGQTLHTGFGGIAGTPQYMSPEQASLNNLDIDTRSDIYSLGVLLYELLTGSPPFAQKDLEKAGMLEMLRVIREEEPPRPSTKLSTADALPSLSANRGTEPKKLTGILRNELDWIVMKALEKDRVRRYETANGFAADINRYLAGEPVNAHPPSAAYRMKKFLRKYRGPVIATAAVAAALLVGIVGFAWQAQVAQSERDIANDERNRALTAETETKKRADELKMVSDFQALMLSQVDPTQAGIMLTQDISAKFEAALTKAGIADDERKKQVEVFTTQWHRVNATDAARELIDRTILKPAVAAIDKQFADQPVVDAELRQVLAMRYYDMGLNDVALPLQERTLAIRRRALGDEHPDTLTSINFMGVLMMDCGKHNAAELYIREALDKRRRSLGEEHPDTIMSINNMGILLTNQGKLSEAEPYYHKVLENARRVLGEEHPNTLGSISSFGGLMQAQGKLSAAEPYYREALEKCRRVLGELHPKTLASIQTFGNLLHNQGKLSEAEPFMREALDKYRRVRGEEHPETLNSISNLGNLLHAQGKLSEAEPYLREALEKNRRVRGEEHPETLNSIGTLGSLLQAQGKLSAAEIYVRETMTKNRRFRGEEHPETLNSINNMGSLLQAQGKLAEAEPYYREALEKYRRVLGEEHAKTLASIKNLGSLLESQGKLSAAEPYIREALEKQRRVLGEEHPSTLGSLNNMGSLLQSQGKLSEAEPYYREALEKHRRVLGEEHPNTLGSINNMGSLLRSQGKLSAAEPYYREALEKLRRVLGEEHPNTLGSINNMGMLLKRQGKLMEAEPFLRESLDKHQRVFGAQHLQTLISIGNLGSLRVAQGKQTEAIELLAPVEPATRKAFVGDNAYRVARLLISLGMARTGMRDFSKSETNLVEANSILAQTPGETYQDTRDCIQALIDLYTAWHAAEPGKGYDIKAAEWKAKLEAMKK